MNIGVLKEDNTVGIIKNNTKITSVCLIRNVHIDVFTTIENNDEILNSRIVSAEYFKEQEWLLS